LQRRYAVSRQLCQTICRHISIIGKLKIKWRLTQRSRELL
jgi:hypothetical protein